MNYAALPRGMMATGAAVGGGGVVPASAVRVAVAEEDALPTGDAKQTGDREGDACDASGGKCDLDVKACGCMGKCCCSCFSYRFFGDFLWLRSRDSEVAYAVEANLNLPAPPIQVSPIAVLDQDAGMGFRVGFGIDLTPCSDLVMTYTHFETNTSSQITQVGAGTGISAMTLHPGTLAADTQTVAAEGRHDIDFDLIDLDYRRLLWCRGNTQITGLGGLRWGQLQQNFWANYTDAFGTPPDTRSETDIDFSGVGIRMGLEAEAFAPRRCLMFYAKGYANLLCGEFDATYRQIGDNGATVEVDTQWQAGRIVPTFDLEVGGGYYSKGGNLRITAGYLINVWTNMVKTDDFIHAVQTNDFRDMSSSMTFDGLVARVEGRF
jgi:hypothetical protein